MSNHTHFFIVAKAPQHTLDELVRYLRPAITKEKNAWGEYLLRIDSLFPDINKDEEHAFVGLDEMSGDPTSTDGWFDIQTDERNEISAKDEREYTVTRAIVNDLQIEEGVRYCKVNRRFVKWLDREVVLTNDRAELPKLRLSGNCRWCPPYALVDRLSHAFPDLEFVYGGTTEHTLFERWSAKAGDHCELDRHLFRWEGRVIFVEDGQELEPAWLDPRDEECL